MFNSLQIGRAIAALAVVLHHATLDSSVFYGTAFSDFFAFGNIGVDFFFVLSGFIIFWSHKRDTEGLDAATIYIKKRFIRLYPAFILVSLVMYFAYTLLPSLSMSTRDIGIIPSLFLIPHPTQDPALSVSWTLMHELLFYSIFSIYFISQKALKAIIAAWAVLIVAHAIFEVEFYLSRFILSMHNLEFIMGMLIAALLPTFSTQYSVLRLRTLALLVGGAMIISFILLRKSYFLESPELSTLYVGIGFALLTLGLVLLESQKGKLKAFNSRFLLFLGAASYSIYLIHNPALSILNRIAGYFSDLYPSVSDELWFLAAACLATISGVAYYLIWEKPILQLAKKIIMRPRASIRFIREPSK